MTPSADLSASLRLSGSDYPAFDLPDRTHVAPACGFCRLKYPSGSFEVTRNVAVDVNARFLHASC